jgi:hypothetical protein
MSQIGRPQTRQRISTVRATAKFQSLLAFHTGEPGLVCRLRYGTGLRLMKGWLLWIKDVEFERRGIIVPEGRGHKDLVAMLPDALPKLPQEQLRHVRALWAADWAANRPGRWMPGVFVKKFPRTAESWMWHWAFPAPDLSVAPRSGVRRHHHLSK